MSKATIFNLHLMYQTSHHVLFNAHLIPNNKIEQYSRCLYKSPG